MVGAATRRLTSGGSSRAPCVVAVAVRTGYLALSAGFSNHEDQSRERGQERYRTPNFPPSGKLPVRYRVPAPPSRTHLSERP
jgi:hypothetical protein